MLRKEDENSVSKESIGVCKEAKHWMIWYLLGEQSDVDVAVFAKLL